MSKSNGERLAEALVTDAMLWVITFWTAFIVMVLEGAVASDLGFRTLGYWTCYFGLMLIQVVASVAFRAVNLIIMKAAEHIA